MTVTILQGDCRERLREMVAGSVHSTITSPPYWGLRDYGLPPSIWGGRDDCPHEWGNELPVINQEKRTPEQLADKSTLGISKDGTRPRKCTPNNQQYSTAQKTSTGGQFCCICGCWKGALGLEPTPGDYVSHVVEVFREVKRVLRDDGTVWLNLGDSYSTSPPGNKPNTTALSSGLPNSIANQEMRRAAQAQTDKTMATGLPAKNLIGIPWRVAFALQADGWWIRSDVIWAKGLSFCPTYSGSVMPESCRDRPTSAYEHVFLLSKQKRYYYDSEAVREKYIHPLDRWGGDKTKETDNTKGNQFSVFERPGRERRPNPAGRNLRNVWAINPHGFPGSHFACVSEDTECLTLSGWKQYNQLQQGEILAAYNLETGKLRWEPLQQVAVYDYDGDLYKLGGPSLGMLCTPNHRCIVKTKAGRVHIRRADKLAGGLKVPCAAEWESGTYGFPNDPGPIIAELLGWTVTDGHYKETSTVISQSITANPQKVDRIQHLLDVAGFHYKKYIRHREEHFFPDRTVCQPYDMASFSITKGGDRVIKGYLSLDKTIPPSATLWSRESIQALFDGIVGGDGHRRHDGRIMVVQKDKAFIDAVQILAIRLGYRATVSRRKGGWNVFLVKRKWLGVRHSGGANIKQVPYTGKVWCPSLPSGTFVARRNGRMWITGNTFPPKLIEPMIKAGTSERGCCPKCGGPWVRVTENTGEKYTTQWGRNQNLAKFATDGHLGRQSAKEVIDVHIKRDIGWSPTCSCYCGPAYPEPVPATVLDPFGGAGTTALVARSLGRDAILIELNPDYCEMARRRLDGTEEIETTNGDGDVVTMEQAVMFGGVMVE